MEESGDSLKEPKEVLDLARWKRNGFLRIFKLEPAAKVSGEDASWVLSEMALVLKVESADRIPLPGIPGGVGWEEFDGWTRESLQKAAEAVGARAPCSWAELDPWQAILCVAEGELTVAKAKYAVQVKVANRECSKALLPSADAMDKILRSETFFERSLHRNLADLRAIQAARAKSVTEQPRKLDEPIQESEAKPQA